MKNAMWMSQPHLYVGYVCLYLDLGIRVQLEHRMQCVGTAVSEVAFPECSSISSATEITAGQGKVPNTQRNQPSLKDESHQ